MENENLNIGILNSFLELLMQPMDDNTLIWLIFFSQENITLVNPLVQEW